MFTGVFDRPIGKDEQGNKIYTTTLKRAPAKVLAEQTKEVFVLYCTIDDYAYYYFLEALDEDEWKVQYEGEWIPLRRYLDLRRGNLLSGDDVV